MTTLILKLATAPSFDALKWLSKVYNDFVVLVAESKQMARDAQQRYPFAIE